MRTARSVAQRGGRLPARRMSAGENGPYCRRPPLRAAVRGRRVARVEVAGDLAQALASRVLCLDVTHERVWDRGRSSRRRRLCAPSSRPASLLYETLQRVDRNELRPPRHVQGLEQRQHPPVEGRSAHTERLGRLRPCVSESLDVRRAANGDGRGARGRKRVTPRLLALAPLPAPRHAYNRTKTVSELHQ